MAGLPPVEIRLQPIGLDQVKAALRTARDAVAELHSASATEARKQQRIVEGIAKSEADAVIREHKRMLSEVSKQASQPRNLFGDVRRTGTSEKGLREFSGSSAFEQVFGKTTAMLVGLHGPAGQFVGGVKVLGSVLNGIGSAATFAIGALQQFGGFLLSDIIKPQLSLGTKSAQLANRMGDGTSGSEVHRAINDLFGQNAQADLPEVTKAYEIGATKTKSSDQAEQVAELALKANRAYGLDSGKMAEFIGGKRAALPNLNAGQFEAFISSQIAASAKGASTPEEFVAQQGKIENMLTRFAGSGTEVDKAQRETGIANLLNAATGKGGTGAQAVKGLDKLVEDIGRDAHHPAFKGAVGPGGQVDLVKALTSIVSTTGGDLTQLGGGAKAGSLANVQIGALNKGSIDFVRSLGLSETYKQAGGGAAGEAAVTEQLKRILDPAEGASKLAEDAKKVEADTGYQLDAAMRTLKMTLITALLPALQEHGPKIAEGIKLIADALGKKDLSDAFKGIITAAEALTYGILDVMSKIPGEIGDAAKEARHKLGVATGMEMQTAEEVDKFDPQHTTKELARKELLANAQAFLTPAQMNASMTVGPAGDKSVDYTKLVANLENFGTLHGAKEENITSAAARAQLDPVAIGKEIGDKAGDAFAAKIQALDPARFKPGAERPVQ